jgi:hypothetical protein
MVILHENPREINHPVKLTHQLVTTWLVTNWFVEKNILHLQKNNPEAS